MDQQENKTQPYVESAPPDIGVRLSKRLIITLSIICLIIAAAATLGFLYYYEMHRAAVGGTDLPDKKAARDEQLYHNDFWGFRFKYPGSWWSVIGSFEEGDYFFASERINFIKELEDDQAIIEVKTYNNLQRVSFDAWLKDQEENYFPRGNLQNDGDRTINGFQARQYRLTASRPINNMPYWTMIIVSNQDKRFYQFILETKTAKAQEDFMDVFKATVDTLEFYQGFGG